jgi:hypothetical protein
MTSIDTAEHLPMKGSLRGGKLAGAGARRPWVWLLAIAALAVPAESRANLITVTAIGDRLNQANGQTTTSLITADVDFTIFNQDATSAASNVSGSGSSSLLSGPQATLPWLIIEQIAIDKILLDAQPASGVTAPTLAALTGQTYAGTFTLTDPLFVLIGSFSQTPTDLSISFTATLTDEALLPNFTGAFTFQGQTTPTAPGEALDQAVITASLAGGGTRAFSWELNYLYDPSVTFNGETAQGSETIAFTGTEFTTTGTTLVSVAAVPEPSSLVLLAAGAVAVLGYGRARRMRAALRAGGVEGRRSA